MSMVGVDLDRTLATYKVNGDEEFQPGVVGDPIPGIIDIVKRHLSVGDEIVIFTARVHPNHFETIQIAKDAIDDFCFRVFGRTFEITCMKHPDMKMFYDDRAISVAPNEGMITTCGYIPPGEQTDAIGSILGQ